MSYSPVLGRWLEPDPTGPAYVDGMDLDQAFDSNPIDRLDPMGTQTTTPTTQPSLVSVQNPTFQADGGVTATVKITAPKPGAYVQIVTIQRTIDNKTEYHRIIDFLGATKNIGDSVEDVQGDGKVSAACTVSVDEVRYIAIYELNGMQRPDGQEDKMPTRESGISSINIGGGPVKADKSPSGAAPAPGITATAGNYIGGYILAYSFKQNKNSHQSGQFVEFAGVPNARTNDLTMPLSAGMPDILKIDPKDVNAKIIEKTLTAPVGN